MAATATPAEVRAALQINAEKCAGEAGQRGSVIRGLAALGYHKPPSVVVGRLEGQTLRLYVWKNTPAGDVILATGPNWNPRVIGPEDIQTQSAGVWILASDDGSKAGARAAVQAERASARHPVAPRMPPAKAERVRAAAKPAARVVKHAEPPRVAAATADERAELQTMLKALLG